MTSRGTRFFPPTGSGYPILAGKVGPKQNGGHFGGKSTNISNSFRLPKVAKDWLGTIN